MDPCIDAIPVAAMWLDAGTVRAVNAAAATLLAADPADVADALAVFLDADRTLLLDDAAAVVAVDGETAGVTADVGAVVTADLEHAPVTRTVRSADGPPRRWFAVTLGPHPGGGAIAVLVETSEQHRLDAAMAEVATGIYTTDGELRGQWMPERLARGIGLDGEQFKGVDIYGLVHPDDVPIAQSLVAKARATPGVAATAAIRILHPEHLDAYYRAVVRATWMPDDDALGGLLVQFDTGSIDQQLDAGEHELGTLTLRDATPLGFINLSISGDLVQRSSRAREILRPVGIAEDAADWLDHLRPDDRAVVDDLLASSRAGTLLEPVEVGFTGAGARVWVRLEVVPYRGPTGDVAGTFVHLLDITTEYEARLALADAREQLWYQARHDALTGLNNRIPFIEALTAALAAPRDAGRQCAVLVCDLDGFKEVNDTHGHDMGDEVLREVARRIERSVRPEDTLCRYGGDEFLVLCADVSPTEAEQLADAIVTGVSENVIIGGVIHRLGVSVGVAIAHDGDEHDPDDLVRRADSAMYRAKNAGGQRAVVA